MKKTNLFVFVTLTSLIINVFIVVCNYKLHKTLSVYERGEQARISVEAAREVNKQDTVKIMKLQGQGWNR